METNKRAVVSLPSDTEILITRSFDAPRELVFRTMSAPAVSPLWWGLATTTTIVEEMDVRPGGKYRYVDRSDDGSQMTFFGEYLQVDPPERLVQTSEFDLAPGDAVIDTMTLEERDGRTIMTVLEQCPSKEVRDAILASGMEEGMNESYERLAALLAEQSAA